MKYQLDIIDMHPLPSSPCARIGFKYMDTSIIKAIENGESMVRIKKLIKRGNINQQDCYDNTPLHVAAKFERINVVKLLLHKGANTRIFNIRGIMAAEMLLWLDLPESYRRKI